MGLPAGWVTDAGIPRNAQLKALGNGIVWQQMALALRLLLDLDAAPVAHGGRTLPTPTVADTRDGRHVRQMTLDAIERGASKGANLNHIFENATVGAFHLGGDA